MKLSEIFEIKNGVGSTKIKISQNRDEIFSIPYLRPSSRYSNLIAGFVDPNDLSEKYIFPADSIIVSTNGEGSHTYSYVAPFVFSANSDVAILIPRNSMSLNEKLYYSLCITRNRYKFSYGRKPKGERLAQITLPEKMPHSFEKIILQDTDYIEKSFSSESSISISERSSSYFRLVDLFIFERGKCGSAEKLLEKGNEISYVGAKKEENGFMYSVLRDEKYVTGGNCIVFIGDGQGSVGYSTYQEKDFIGSTTLSMGRNKNLNKFNALFIITLLDKERFKYSFGRKWNGEKLKNTKIKLPVDSAGNPDWRFMEDYIKSLPYSASV